MKNIKNKYFWVAIATVCIILLSCGIYFAFGSISPKSTDSGKTKSNTVVSKSNVSNNTKTTRIVTITNEYGKSETVVVTDKNSKEKKTSKTETKNNTKSLPDATEQKTANKDAEENLQNTGKKEPVAMSLQESNLVWKRNIYNRYGVSVLSGSDADIFEGGICYKGLTDEELIAEWLGYIEKELARYPSGFFRDFSDITTFKIKLISYLNNKQGYASYEIATDMYIGINTDPNTGGFPGRMLNHEIMHVIDQYIRLKSWDSNAQEYISPLDETEKIIPAGFVWGSSNSSYTIYDTSVPVENRYFVSVYAKTNGREDRAETFTDYMFRSYQRDYMKSSSYPISRKQALIAKNIRDYFPSAAKTPQGSLPWERFLN